MVLILVSKNAGNKDTSNGDVSVMTYRGHSILQTLIRCRFSPPHCTGQKYIYTGCALGRVIGNMYKCYTPYFVFFILGNN